MVKNYTILAAKNNIIYVLGYAFNQGIAYSFELSIKHMYDATRITEGKAKESNYTYCDGWILKKTGVN